MRTRPGLSWLLLLLPACSGDSTSPVRPCDRLGLLCAEDDRIQSLGLSDTRNVSADLDGDGVLDLVTAGGPSGLSIGWGGTDLRDYHLFPGPVPDARIGDLDHDGRLDITFLTSEPAALHILTGTGTTQLNDGPIHTLAGQPQALWLGHLDADDRLDAVVASSGEGTLTILTDGLTRARPITVGRDLVAVDTADLNGDHRLDLVAVDQGDAAFHLVLATGDDFAAPRRIATGLAPRYLQLLDHDGDGHVDVLTHGKGPEIWFHQGDGAGSFAPARALLVQTSASQGFGAHRDEQGQRWLLTIDRTKLTAHRLDAADQVTGRIRVGSIRALTNLTMDAGAAQTAGTWFGARYSLATAPIFLERWSGDLDTDVPPVFGDLDQDGVPELASRQSRAVLLHKQAPDGSWTELARLEIVERTANVALGDVTGDGVPDVTIADNKLGVRVAVGAGDGTFIQGPDAALPVEPHHLRIVVPPGGAPRLIVASQVAEQPGIHALRFDAAGGLIDQSQLALAGNVTEVAVADLDNDGGDDLVTLVRADDTLALVLIPITADGWGPPRSRPLAAVLPDLSPAGTVLAVGDLDLDDNLDAVLVSRSTSARLMNIASDLPLAPRLDEVDNDASAVAIADLDADGRPDLALCSHDGVSIALATADDTLQPQPPYDPFFHNCALHVAPDLAETYAAFVVDDRVTVLTPDIAPALVHEANFRGGPTPLADLATGDIDGDGHTDIVVGAPAADPVSSFAVLWGQADGRPQRATWTEGWRLYNESILTVAPFDERPGDEILLAYTGGSIEVYSHTGATLALIAATTAPLDDCTAVGVQARRDGPGDLLLLGTSDREQWRLLALPRDPTGAFIDPANFPTLWTGPFGPYPVSFTIADFDLDGHDDIVLLLGRGPALTLVWGDELRAPAMLDFSAPSSVTSVTHADLDNDGQPELIVGTEASVAAFRFTGRDPGAATKLIHDSAAEGLLVADLEGDGHADLLRRDGDFLNLTLRAPAGDTLLQLPVDPAWQRLHAADLDNDGILDLLGLKNGALVTRLSAPQTVETP